ncbi:MAG: peptidoglycan DD-metalloendopeptidase family protein [Syntrophomonadaceae bacterium]|jgi:murein DD-endopeptidase MepM/ murein hydrolase activator NlpD
MLGSFKVRLLLVIFIVAVVGLLWQASDSSRQIVEPALRYITETNYNISEIAQNLINNGKEGQPEQAVPAATSSILQTPCDILEIERNFGWHYNSDYEKEEFYPGMMLKVAAGTMVKPIMEGEVEQISGEPGDRSLLVKHANEFYSLYGGLREILVETGENVDMDRILGKTGTTFYFEIRNEDGPLNPQSLFEQ